MGFWDQFPYTNFHDMNLDWILRKVKIFDTIEPEVLKNAEKAEKSANSAERFAQDAADSARAAEEAVISGRSGLMYEFGDVAFTVYPVTERSYPLMEKRVVPDVSNIISPSYCIIQGGCHNAQNIVATFADVSYQYAYICELDNNLNVLRKSELLELGHANDIAYDFAQDKYYVAMAARINGSTIAVVNSDFTLSEYKSIGEIINEIAFDEKHGLIYGIDYRNNLIHVCTRGFDELATVPFERLLNWDAGAVPQTAWVENGNLMVSCSTDKGFYYVSEYELNNGRIIRNWIYPCWNNYYECEGSFVHDGVFHTMFYIRQEDGRGGKGFALYKYNMIAQGEDYVGASEKTGGSVPKFANYYVGGSFCPGHITTNGNDLYFQLPVTIKFDSGYDSKNPTLRGKISVRGINGFLANELDLEDCQTTLYRNAEGGLFVLAKKTGGWGGTNNTPVTVQTLKLEILADTPKVQPNITPPET